MRSSHPILWSAVIGAVHGAVESAILFTVSQKYALAQDWLLPVVIVLVNAFAFGVAARYAVNLVGVAVVGVAGLMVGGWLGNDLIGSYSYTVPTPREERVLQIVTPRGQRDIELRDVPPETERRIPVGAGIGMLLGFTFGALAYGLWTRPRETPLDETAKQDEALE